jgi:transcription initiation factor IIF auxiliary subunit
VIKRVITKSALLKRLEELEKVVPSNEPFIVFIEQVDEDCFKVTTQVSKGKQKVEMKTYEVSSLDEFYKLNPVLVSIEVKLMPFPADLHLQ